MLSTKALAKPQSLSISGIEMEAIYRLWDELDLIPTGETDKALRDLALGMMSLLSADNVKWMAAVRVLQGAEAKKDPLLGWRLRASYDLVPESEAYKKLIAPMFQRNNRLDPSFLIGLATHAIVAGAGTFRVHRMRDGWIPFREFRRSEHYKLHYTEQGITDRMWISFPLNDDSESVFLIDRMGSSPHFSKRDAAVAFATLRGIRGFHRHLFLTRGLLIGETALSPVASRIVQKLLTGLSEKEIAISLNQGVATTHKYVQAIYEKFGVNGRAALMSLWLGA